MPLRKPAWNGLKQTRPRPKSSVRDGGEPFWGYIEGYYGRLFTWEERSELLSHLAELGGNAYLYAPKEDPLHRRDWRVPYSSAWRREFRLFTASGTARGVKVIPGMAPGLSFDYTSPADYRALLAKLKTFQSLGCSHLALLMDDIPAVLPRSSAGRFRSLGEAHGLLLQRLREDLRREGRRGGLWFCPTVYTDQFATGSSPAADGLRRLERDPYLADLAASIPKDVTVMWTGPRIISPSLSKTESRSISRLFQGNVVIWDNLYANDYCPNKLFVGPYQGRSSALWKSTRGALLNPTGLLHTDKFLLSLLAAARGGEKPLSAWKRVVAEFDIPVGFAKTSRFLASPFFTPRAEDLTPKKIGVLRKALKPLIWDWKSPLQREWYPFLFMLDADLKASSRGGERPDPEWIRKRYSPLAARLLLGR